MPVQDYTREPMPEKSDSIRMRVGSLRARKRASRQNARDRHGTRAYVRRYNSDCGWRSFDCRDRSRHAVHVRPGLPWSLNEQRHCQAPTLLDFPCPIVAKRRYPIGRANPEAVVHQLTIFPSQSTGRSSSQASSRWVTICSDLAVATIAIYLAFLITRFSPIYTACGVTTPSSEASA